MRQEFLIPLAARRDFEKRLAVLNRFAVRHKVAPAEAFFDEKGIREKIQKMEVETRFDSGWADVSVKTNHNAITVIPVSLEVPDMDFGATRYSPVAVLVNTDDGGGYWNVTKSQGGADKGLVEAVVELSHSKSCKCQNCKRSLSAKAVVIRDDETGSIFTSGTECAELYLGVAFGARIAALEFADQIAFFINACVDEVERGSGRAWESARDLEEYLAFAAVAARVSGEVPKWATTPRGDKVINHDSTWSLASGATCMPIYPADPLPEKIEAVKNGVTAEDRALAKRVADGMRAITDSEAEESEFAEKARVIAMQGWVSARNTGIVISSLLQTIKRERNAVLRASSDHFGKAGERITFRAKVVGQKLFESSFGPQIILSFMTEQGNLAKWFTKAAARVPVGEEFDITATIKGHSEFNGTKETELSRCKLEVVKEKRMERASELVKSAALGDTQAVGRLVEAGVPVDTTAYARVDAKGRDSGLPVTALHAAVRAGKTDTVDALLAAGANPTIATRAGVTPAAQALLNGDDGMAAKLEAAEAQTKALGEAVTPKFPVVDAPTVRKVLKPGAQMSLDI